MAKVLVIGAGGTIGKHVVQALEKDHGVIGAGRNSGDVRVDISSPDSIRSMYQALPDLDAVVCIAGEAKWAPFGELNEKDFYVGIRSKLMGQVNLVTIGQHHVKPGASFTLTTGILGERPVPSSAGPSMVNGSIHSFVLAAAGELEGQCRVNVVAAGLVEDSAEAYADFFPGHSPVAMKDVARAYKSCVEGDFTGEVVRVYE